MALCIALYDYHRIKTKRNEYYGHIWIDRMGIKDFQSDKPLSPMCNSLFNVNVIYTASLLGIGLDASCQCMSAEVFD
jgi:hypothetical protein